MDKKKFISLCLPGALAAFEIEKILPSLTLAQALLESGNGDSCPGNNCFGIKWTEGCGHSSQLLITSEYYTLPQYNSLKASKAWYELVAVKNGQYHVHIKAKFRKYKSIADCVLDHSKFLSTDRYKSVRGAKTYKEACEQIKKDGYATDPKYPTLLESIILTNKLYQYDK